MIVPIELDDKTVKKIQQAIQVMNSERHFRAIADIPDFIMYAIEYELQSVEDELREASRSED